MSDVFLQIIPAEPEFVPMAEARETARNHFARMLPDADAILVRTTADITFVDAGSNFESLWCPACDADLTMNWWTDAMDAASKRFTNLIVSMPCCGIPLSLDDLRYDAPQGFARFVLEARNPNVASVENAIKPIQDIVGAPLRAIWSRL